MEASEVKLYEAPYVYGMRAVAYFTGINASVFYEDADDWDGATEDALESLCEKAAAAGANSVVGLEITCDPFAVNEKGDTGLRVSVIGTPVVLEALY